MAQTIWPDSEARRAFLLSMSTLADLAPTRRGLVGRPFVTVLSLTVGVVIATAFR